MKKTYYAAVHSYGINIANDVHTIYRFDSKKARDEFIDREGWNGSSYHREAVTRDQARRIFPDAFRMVGNSHDRTDMRDWIEHHDTCTWAYWCPSNIYYA